MRLHVVLLIVVTSSLTGCATTFTTARPADFFSANRNTGDDLQGSLFTSDAAVLSDSDLTRILEYKYSAPAQSRIALLPFGWNTWSGWSEEMAVSTSAVDADVLSTLRASPRIYDASFLPSILIPETRKLPFLREAAARYQADLLLAFRSSCQSFQRYRLLSDTTRAWCSVEAILLDVRTGLVPFAASSTQNFQAEEADEDLNFRETVMRAQLESIASALGEISEAIVEFVEPGVGGQAL